MVWWLVLDIRIDLLFFPKAIGKKLGKTHDQNRPFFRWWSRNDDFSTELPSITKAAINSIVLNRKDLLIIVGISIQQFQGTIILILQDIEGAQSS